MRMPVKSRCRCALLHLQFGDRDGLMQTIPQPDVTLLVPSREVFLRWVESKARKSIGRDKLDESSFEIGC